MAHQKLHLPHKTCPVCQRPFAWRKRWRNNWEQVRYCSRRCASSRVAKAEPRVLR